MHAQLRAYVTACSRACVIAANMHDCAHDACVRDCTHECMRARVTACAPDAYVPDACLAHAFVTAFVRGCSMRGRV
eukprot:6193505-Pleurochrysis_carterae.AAC.2